MAEINLLWLALGSTENKQTISKLKVEKILNKMKWNEWNEQNIK